MQIRLSWTALCAAALACAPAAHAEPANARAKLVEPVAAISVAKVGGVSWRCEDQACAAEGERASRLDSFMKECRKTAAVLGPLAAYESRGREMSPGMLESCNRAAAPATQLQAAR